MLAKGAVSAALTEPGVGSDPAQMSTTAIPTEDGEHFLLSGRSSGVQMELSPIYWWLCVKRHPKL